MREWLVFVLVIAQMNRYVLFKREIGAFFFWGLLLVSESYCLVFFQEFCDEWSMLTWNVLCITSRLQNSLLNSVTSSEDKVIFSRLNVALVDLVNSARFCGLESALFWCLARLNGIYWQHKNEFWLSCSYNRSSWQLYFFVLRRPHVFYFRESVTPPVIDLNDPHYVSFQTSLSNAMHSLHGLYKVSLFLQNFCIPCSRG